MSQRRTPQSPTTRAALVSLIVFSALCSITAFVWTRPAYAVELTSVRTALTPIMGQAAAAIVSAILAPGALASVLYFFANWANRALSRPSDEPGFMGVLDRLLDRICVTTRAGALNRWSVPVLGRSLFADVLNAIADETGRHSVVAPPSESPSDRSKGGFIERRFALAIAAVFVVGIAVAASCKLPPPDGCEPYVTRCSPAGVPQLCSGSQRWQQSMADGCPEGSVCGPVMIHGRVRHACAPPSAIVDVETGDAAADQ